MVYDLISFLATRCGRDSMSHPVDNDTPNSGLSLRTHHSARNLGKSSRRGRLTNRRWTLDDRRYDCWARNYRLRTEGEVGVMSDTILPTLVSSIRIGTVDDLLGAVPNCE